MKKYSAFGYFSRDIDQSHLFRTLACEVSKLRAERAAKKHRNKYPSGLIRVIEVFPK